MDKLLLFKEMAVTKAQYTDGFGRIHPPPDGIPWEETEIERVCNFFITEIKSPDDIPEIIKKDVNSKYFLVQGKFIDIKYDVPVYVDGRTLNAFKAEFGESKGLTIGR